MVWQSLALFLFLDARRNVEFGLRMRGIPAPAQREKAMAWLERMEIVELADPTWPSSPEDSASGCRNSSANSIRRPSKWGSTMWAS